MPDDINELDAAIIHDAYAEKVREAFKVFAENLGMGQNQKNSLERFLRTLELVRKARAMALEAASGAFTIEAAPVPEAHAAEASPTAAMEGLSAEERAMVEQALAGTTGHRPLR